MPTSTASTRLGKNRTGMQTSPALAKAMLENAEEDVTEPTASFDGQALAEMRASYIRDADPLGSIPPPTTAKGAAKSGAKMMTGKRPQAFLDKLGERLAYERGGARLYDAAIAKFLAHASELRGVNVEELRQIRDEEVAHALLVQECIEKLGADPTVQTPSADLVGVQTMGLLQAVTDPRTSLAHTLNTLLAAELIDEAGWEILIAMAENMGQSDMAARFREAEEREQEHVFKARGWYEALTVETERLV